MYSATVGVESLKPILPHHSAAYDHDAIAPMQWERLATAVTTLDTT